MRIVPSKLRIVAYMIRTIRQAENKKYFENQLRITLDELQIVAYIKRTIRKAVNEYYEVCTVFLKLTIFLVIWVKAEFYRESSKLLL